MLDRALLPLTAAAMLVASPGAHAQPPQPAASVSAASATGGLSTAALDADARRQRAGLSVCLAGRTSFRGGAVSLAVEIDAHGRVSRVSRERETELPADVARCVVAQIRRWRFASAGRSTTATLRVSLRPYAVLLAASGDGAEVAPRPPPDARRRPERAPAEARLRSDHVHVEGGRDAAPLRRTIDRTAFAARACYRDALVGEPGLEGRVFLEVHVDPDGAVRRATLRRSTLRHADAERCILSRVRQARFPATEGADPTRVRFEYVLSTEPAER